MAENKKSFLLYCDLINTVKKLPKVKQGELFITILEYVNDMSPEVKDLSVDLVFEPIKLQLKRDLIKYEEKKGKKSISGREGNLKRWYEDLYNDYKDGKYTLEAAELMAQGRKASQPDGTQSQSIANIAVTDTVTDTVTDKDILKQEINFDKFLDWFNERRTKYIEKPSNIKRLTIEQKATLNNLKNSYSTNDFEVAVYNLCNDKWANENNQVLCSYFLKTDIFNKFLSTEKTTMLSKNQRRRQGWKV